MRILKIRTFSFPVYLLSLERDRKLEHLFSLKLDSFSCILNKWDEALSASLLNFAVLDLVLLDFASTAPSPALRDASPSLASSLPHFFLKLYFLSDRERVSREPAVGALVSSDSLASEEPCSKLRRVLRVERRKMDEATLHTELVGDTWLWLPRTIKSSLFSSSCALRVVSLWVIFSSVSSSFFWFLGGRPRLLGADALLVTDEVIEIALNWEQLDTTLDAEGLGERAFPRVVPFEDAFVIKDSKLI